MNGSTLAIGLAAMVAVAASGVDISANDANPRLGVWQMHSDAPPPSKSIMIYEAYEDTGIRITVAPGPLVG